MAFKLVVLGTFFLILTSLGSGLYYMLKDKGHGQRTVKALSLRITLSLFLFILLFIAYAAGWIAPHGIYPQP